MRDNHLMWKAHSLAIKARGQYNLSTIHPVDTFKILFVADILCVKEPLSDDISGIYTKADNVKIIIINTNKTVGHQNFTAAHELYHAVYEEALEDQVCLAGAFDFTNEREAVADLFAANFLMPEDGLRYYLAEKRGSRKTVELSDVIYLEQVFGVSHLSMLRRLEELSIIGSRRRVELLPNIRRNAIMYGYGDYLYQPSGEKRFISDYVAKVTLAYEEKKITTSRYRELLADADIPANVEGVEDFVD